ncbi:hypothetical protein Ancab_002234 [Ancistrocladus abbreviatus]
MDGWRTHERRVWRPKSVRQQNIRWLLAHSASGLLMEDVGLLVVHQPFPSGRVVFLSQWSVFPPDAMALGVSLFGWCLLFGFVFSGCLRLVVRGFILVALSFPVLKSVGMVFFFYFRFGLCCSVNVVIDDVWLG